VLDDGKDTLRVGYLMSSDAASRPLERIDRFEVDCAFVCESLDALPSVGGVTGSGAAAGKHDYKWELGEPNASCNC
jgi:hypothetical protein